MSFYIVEVDNEGFQFLDENGNALSSELDATLRRLVTKAKIQNAAGTVIDPAVEHTAADSPHAARLTDGSAFYKPTTPSDTQPISAAALPLPSGAATESTLTTRATEATLATRASETTVAALASPGASRLATGTISALNGTVEINTQDCANTVVQVTGTWVGVFCLEATVNGTDWFMIVGYAVGYGGGAFDSWPSNAVVRVPTAGFAKIRVKATSYTSGTINVAIMGAKASAVTKSSISQAVTASSSNDTTANLAAGASFTGSGESTLGVGAIQVNHKSDQPCLIKIQQSTDNVNWDISDDFTIKANAGNSWTVQATASYFRVIVTNIGASTTTFLRFQVALAPIIEALPRKLVHDTEEDIFRLPISGKVAISIPPPPPGGTSVTIAADNPLETGDHTVTYVIPNEKIFHIQQIVVGAAGDPTEKGSKVTITYNNGTEHVVERIYVSGFTNFGSYPDTGIARDGTILAGNGSTFTLTVNRLKISGTNREIDAVVRGYVQ